MYRLVRNPDGSIEYGVYFFLCPTKYSCGCFLLTREHGRTLICARCDAWPIEATDRRDKTFSKILDMASEDLGEAFVTDKIAYAWWIDPPFLKDGYELIPVGDNDIGEL